MSAPTPPEALLLDADGTLFPSEAPAFDASALVTHEFARRYGLRGDFSAGHLLATTTGVNFRTTAARLLAEAGVTPDAEEFEDWVEREKREVSAHLGRVLRPDPAVLDVLGRAARRSTLAAVSSSALGRLDACFRACGLAELIPAARRFSAEDSLARPTSKPDPAIYRHALQELGVSSAVAVAVEDSVTGARSAVAAGISTMGLTAFVPAAERASRAADLTAVGAVDVVDSWSALGAALDCTVSV